MIATGRRSPSRSTALLGGAGLGTSEGDVAPARTARADRIFRRSPTAETPMSLRSSAVNWGRTSASILLSRKFASYWPRPRLRSHPLTSMDALHADIYGNRPAQTCPARGGNAPSGNGCYLRIAAFHRDEFERQQYLDCGRSTGDNRRGGFLLGRLSDAGPKCRTTIPSGAGVRNPSPYPKFKLIADKKRRAALKSMATAAKPYGAGEAYSAASARIGT